MFGFKNLMEQAQNLQERISEIQAQLANKTVTGSAGGDMVVVTATGSQEITSVKIERSIVQAGDVEMIEELVAAAANDAIRKSKDLVSEEFSKLTGGIRIPGLT